MGKQWVKQPTPPRWGWRWVVLGVVLLLIGGGAAGWWLSAAPDAAAGRPRLVLDRDVVDLGYLPFEAPARVVFTLSNAGDGPLKLADVPRVKAVKGC